MRAAKPPNGLAWLCVGDFNEILLQEEKYGVAMRPYSQVEAFRLAMEDSELSNLGYLGDRFIWRNNREGQQFTKERLDRGFGNARWQELFPSYLVSHEIAKFRS